MEHKYNASNAAVPIKRVWESDGAIMINSEFVNLTLNCTEPFKLSKTYNNNKTLCGWVLSNRLRNDLLTLDYKEQRQKCK